MAQFIFRGCRRCAGDLFINQGDWQCLQCGHYFYRLSRPPPDNAFWDYWRAQSTSPSQSSPSPSVVEPPVALLAVQPRRKRRR